MPKDFTVCLITDSYSILQGCYEAGKQWARYYSGWIIGLGVGFATAAVSISVINN